MLPPVTFHAIARYQERVEPVSDDEARAALSSPFIMRAIAFGAHCVRLGTGHRVIIRDKAIVTVLPGPVKRKRLRNGEA
jgi:hypothetical protein